MEKALVTGGAGFIGSNMVQALLKEGFQVRVFDNFSTGKKENIEGFKKKIELVEGDLTDPDSVLSAVKGMDFIFHFGAIPSVVRSVEDPMSSHHANITGTLNLLQAARQSSIKRLVYSSSSSVYGDQPTLPKEEMMKQEPLSPYAATKLAGEHYTSIFCGIYKVPAVSLRYFNVFGPRQDPNSLYSAVIPRFINCLIKKKPPTIYGDGQQTRDFTYVDNVVQANLLASRSPSKTLGKTYNIAGGKPISLLQLLEEMKKILNVQIEPVFESPRSGDIRDSWASVERAEKDLGYHTSVPLNEGLKKTIEWFLSGSQS